MQRILVLPEARAILELRVHGRRSSDGYTSYRWNWTHHAFRRAVVAWVRYGFPGAEQFPVEKILMPADAFVPKSVGTVKFFRLRRYLCPPRTPICIRVRTLRCHVRV